MFNTISVGGKGAADALVIGLFSGEKLDSRSQASVAGVGHTAPVLAALKRPEATGDAGMIVDVTLDAPGAASGKGRKGKDADDEGGAGTRVLIVGLGKREAFDVGALRTVAGNVGRKLSAIKAQAVQVELGGALGQVKGADAARAGSAFGEGLGLIGWVCDEFKGKATPAPKRTSLKVRSSDAEFSAGLERGLGLAVSANLCRTLSNTPPNIATPAYMAEKARRMAREVGLKWSVIEGDALEREKMTGLINVGKASENKPCMIRLEYQPAGGASARSRKPLVLIGKTMSYDSGGLSLKVNNGMVGMKRDKDGGCAVLGAMHAIATVIKPRRPVVALLAAAENSISDEAYRPDDILTYRNGVSVEITNTDAEGRLVLADALCWACEKENPSGIIDLATLTGGVVVALGSTFCGMFCEDDALRGRVETAAKASGERVWRLPMHEEYREMMKSPIAAILNSNPNRKAHPIQGAAFLSYFVEKNVAWCHLDIAGVHVAEKNAGCFVDGPTGWGVRLLAELAEGE